MIAPGGPRLCVRVIDDDGNISLTVRPNAICSFENDLFVGRFLWKIRNYPGAEQYEDYFAGRKRVFDVQYQGQFKIVPSGACYLGGELKDGKMDLGMMAGALARVVLGMLRRLTTGMQHGFGNGKDGPDATLPHLVFPVWVAADRLVVTPAGEEPPPMGVEMFPDTMPKKQRIEEMGRKGGVGFDTESTYSFSCVRETARDRERDRERERERERER
jgi:hypothetical protein